MLTRLERKKLVVRKQDTEDGRVRIVHLTAKGQKVHHKLWEKSQGLRIEMEGLFKADEMKKLVASLNRLAHLLNPACD